MPEERRLTSKPEQDYYKTEVNVKTLLHMRDIGGDNFRRDD